MLQSQVEVLEKDLHSKLRQLKTSDQQELKEDDKLKEILDSLHSKLHMIADRVVKRFQTKIKLIRNPNQLHASEIESLQQQLAAHKQALQQQADQEEIKEKNEPEIEQFKALAQIKNRINSLHKPTDFEWLTTFSEEGVQSAIVKEIEKKGEKETDDPQEWRLLGYEEIYDLKSGARINSIPSISLPSYQASFQVNRRLYICGGSTWEMNMKLYLSNLFSQDYYANWKEHSRMAHKRNALSLTGNVSFLFAVGGWCDQDMANVEQYSIIHDKWEGCPDLNIPRQRPGTYVLPDFTVFCFCGYYQDKYINSVEKLDHSNRWELVKTNFEPACTDHLIANVLDDHVILFGGDQYSCFCMYALDFEGNLIRDLSSVKNIPGDMGKGASVVRGGRIYAFGSRKEWNWEWKPRIWSQDEWKLI